MHTIHPLWGAWLLGVSAMAMAGPAHAGPNAVDGIWGGDRLQLRVEAGVGQIAMDCANGRIDGPIQPDAQGRFRAAGSFVQEQGGPQRADEPAAGPPAQYSGVITGSAMRLTIQPQDGAAQQFDLRKGVQVKLVRCL